MGRILNFLNRQSDVAIGAIVALLTLLVGYLDYITGTHVSMSAFYLLPLGLASWRLGFVRALIVAVANVALWMLGNIVGGDPDFLNPTLAAWNGGVQLASYVVVAIAIGRVRSLQQGLEQRVRERTADLESLQRDLLQISEREQRRIGQDLHDGLCQHLAAAAFTCQALREELAEKGLPEAQSAQTVVDLIKEGVLLSRQSAKGLYPVEISAGGLMHALEEFASTTRSLFNIACRFECDSPVLIHDGAVAGHLFRIAQEATRNATSHGRAKNILIMLALADDGLELSVEDDGVGIENAARTGKGMGLTIMRQRAAIIGAHFAIETRTQGGTIVRCRLPAPILAKEPSREQENV